MVSQSMHDGNSAIFLMLKGGKPDLLAAWANHAPGHLVEFTVTEDARGGRQQLHGDSLGTCNE